MKEYHDINVFKNVCNRIKVQIWRLKFRYHLTTLTLSKDRVGSQHGCVRQF